MNVTTPVVGQEQGLSSLDRNSEVRSNNPSNHSHREDLYKTKLVMKITTAALVVLAGFSALIALTVKSLAGVLVIIGAGSILTAAVSIFAYRYFCKEHEERQNNSLKDSDSNSSASSPQYLSRNSSTPPSPKGGTDLTHLRNYGLEEMTLFPSSFDYGAPGAPGGPGGVNASAFSAPDVDSNANANALGEKKVEGKADETAEAGKSEVTAEVKKSEVAKKELSNGSKGDVADAQSDAKLLADIQAIATGTAGAVAPAGSNS